MKLFFKINEGRFPEVFREQDCVQNCGLRLRASYYGLRLQSQSHSCHGDDFDHGDVHRQGVKFPNPNERKDYRNSEMRKFRCAAYIVCLDRLMRLWVDF